MFDLTRKINVFQPSLEFCSLNIERGNLTEGINHLENLSMLKMLFLRRPFDSLIFPKFTSKGIKKFIFFSIRNVHCLSISLSP